MDIQQDLVTYFLKWRKRSKQKALDQRKQARHTVELTELKESLSYFASAIFSRPIEIRVTDEMPYVSGTKLFLPSFLGISSSVKANYHAYHIMVLHLWAISTLIPASRSLLPLYQDFSLVNGQLAEARRLLIERFPNYTELYDNLSSEWNEDSKRLHTPPVKEFKLSSELGFDPRVIWGKTPRLPQLIEGDDTVPEVRTAFPEVTTEKQSKSKGEIKKVEMDEDQENIGQDVFHHFEKVETAEEYTGGVRETDGADEMAAHADALDDLNIDEVIRSKKSAQSLYKTELDMGFEMADLQDNTLPDPKDEVLTYDEWDEKKRIYKKDWCRVTHSKRHAGESRRTKSLKTIIQDRAVEINKLKKKLIQLTSEIRVFKRLYSGPSIDIDNVIRIASRRKSGDSGDQRYYQETRKRHRDMACLLLVDTSLSSDSWVQNKRVLDVCLEALMIFGEATASLGDPVMVAGFNSNTRHDCKFLQWKSFEEPWSKFMDQADGITPEGYTRIGPAIRHATHVLSQRKERHKLLLIFTDGRPTDFDKYEGQYGLGDVRQAVREADREGVTTFALTVDPSAKHFLPQLFGLGNFQILQNIQTLPDSLAKLYARMAKNS